MIIVIIIISSSSIVALLSSLLSLVLYQRYDVHAHVVLDVEDPASLLVLEPVARCFAYIYIYIYIYMFFLFLTRGVFHSSPSSRRRHSPRDFEVSDA